MSGALLARGRIRRMNRAALSLAAALFLAAPMALAQVPPRGARLSYTRGPGTEGCPEEPSLRQIVASQLGGVDPFVRDGAWHIEVVIRRKGTAFQGEIALHDRDGRALGRQEHSSAICGALVEDIGLSLSAFMRPLLPSGPAPESVPISPLPGPPPPSVPRGAASRVPPGASPGAPASKPPNLVAVPARPAPRPRPPPDRPRLQLGAGVLLGAGVAPSVAVGFSGFAGARWERFSLSLEARGDLPIDAEPYRGWTFGVSGLSGSVVPCGHADWFFGCALATAGGLWNVRDSTGRELVLPYAGLGFRAGLEMPLSARLAGQLSGDLSINIHRTHIRPIHGEGWSVAPVSEAVALRLVAFF
ncbi:hypothetical protein [Sorangium atrum]|uniref:Secreted protein n=1 Tax=Sorangium atrum TaxID=2995308 RepID=A0ABT5C0P3_9BACT|nr:hypothetical protein [Sorangium aterium]MDC0679946.1 hypothetical protein [Sorangium aterium]